MKTKLHLLSMPMHDPLHPSAQLGYLHGHVKRAFGNRLGVHSYSGHSTILFDLEGAGMGEYFSTHRLFGEEIFFLACCYDYPRLFEQVYTNYQKFRLPEVHLLPEQILRLCEAMRSYLRSRLLPSLASEHLNVIGMTATFAQFFASIFAAKFIRDNTDKSLLFVFGGASMSLPEAARALHLWEVPSLFVTGAGEGPLEKILNCCLELKPEHANLALDHISERGIVNVNQTGCAAKPINLNLSRSEMDGIGDPDYDEFFSNLRSLCASSDVYDQLLELIAIPIEGSRGCFARCDFCQNPNITTRFRSLTGQQVAARARRLTGRYRADRLYFADSVCNSWAEDYADDLLAHSQSFSAFMEMRVHAPESFFAKLAVVGVKEMQLGIEALSDPLLRAIGKGTSVLQNLRAAKYLAELGIKSASNLITHHPKSTVADIEETKRVIRLTRHFPQLSLSRFVISYASPIYNALSAEQLGTLTRGFTWLPEDLKDYSLVRDLAYPYPDAWLDPELDAEWETFRRWYNDMQARSGLAKLVVECRDSVLEITDTRFDAMRRHRLTGETSKVFNLCHAGPTFAALVNTSGLSVRCVFGVT